MGLRNDSAHLFVAVEGCNGVGKSTIVKHLAERFDARVFHFPPAFVNFRRAVELDARVPAIPRLLYYCGAILDLSDRVGKALRAGHVICDRYWLSPLSLMLAENAVEEKLLEEWSGPFLARVLEPDLLLLLEADFRTAAERIRQRAESVAPLTRTARRSLEIPEFHERRAAWFARLAAPLPQCCRWRTDDLDQTASCALAASRVTRALGARRATPTDPMP